MRFFPRWRKKLTRDKRSRISHVQLLLLFTPSRRGLSAGRQRQQIPRLALEGVAELGQDIIRGTLVPVSAGRAQCPVGKSYQPRGSGHETYLSEKKGFTQKGIYYKLRAVVAFRAQALCLLWDTGLKDGKGGWQGHRAVLRPRLGVYGRPALKPTLWAPCRLLRSSCKRAYRPLGAYDKGGAVAATGPYRKPGGYGLAR